jgi:hypothetical protein
MLIVIELKCYVTGLQRKTTGAVVSFFEKLTKSYVTVLPI